MCVHCTLYSRKTSSCLNYCHSKLERQMKHFVCARYILFFCNKKTIEKPLENSHSFIVYVTKNVDIHLLCRVCARFFNFGGLDLDSNFMRLIWKCAALTLSLEKTLPLWTNEWRHNVSASCVLCITINTPSQLKPQSCYINARDLYLSDRFTFSTSQLTSIWLNYVIGKHFLGFILCAVVTVFNSLS